MEVVTAPRNLVSDATSDAGAGSRAPFVGPVVGVGIGVVVPYDFALDRELWRWVPDDISLHLTRTPYVPLAVTMEMVVHVSDPVVVARGATELKAVSPLVTAYACTSGSFVGGLA